MALRAGISDNTFIPVQQPRYLRQPGQSQSCLPTFNQPQAWPGNLIDPVAQKMLSYFPEPNITTSDGIYRNWIGTGPNHSYNWQFDIKIDHRFNENNLMSVKYSQQYSHGDSFNCFKNFTDPCEGGPNWTNAHLFAINDTHTFTPTLLLNTTLGLYPRRVAYRRLQPARRE